MKEISMFILFILGIGLGIWLGLFIGFLLAIREDIIKLEEEIDKLYT